MIVAGIVVGVVPGARLVAGTVRTLADTFTAPEISAPADVGLDLDEGRHLVFVRRGGPPLSPERAQVVTVASGRRVPVSRCSCDETTTKGERVFVASLVFEVADAGPHALRFAGPRREVIVTESIVDVLDDDGLGTSLLWGALGAVVATVGVALLVLALVGRRRAGP